MSQQNNNLEVKPVKRYSSPQYPSYLDPDPSCLPEAYPYPFRHKAMLAAATLGFSGLLQSVSAAEPAKTNPFIVSSSGLPYRSSPYGTGRPSRISDENARKLIDKIFKEKGFVLQPNFKYKKGGIEFTASGYDPAKKIGYLYGTWNTLDHADAVLSWMRPRKGQPIDANRLKYFLGKEYSKQLAEATKIADDAERQKAFRALLEDKERKEGVTRLSLKEANILEKRAEKEQEHIALISQFDRRFEYSGSGRIDSKEREKIMKISDPKERQAAFKLARGKSAKQAMKKLEEAVRRYIEWTRTQGI
ncbi:MAG: hypothetical protein L3J71_17695 [Victivallaceae bacterium]|nr:hypothetical protein [Victivallaceae bacterium]